MRLISALLCFCLTFNVMASAGTIQEFERALDDYQYSLTVEWDQKDAAFMQDQTEEFYTTLSSLMDKGLTSEEIMKSVANKVKNPKDLEALKLKMNLLTASANGPTELAKMISQNSKDFYSTGASWDGYVLLSVGVGVVLAALIGYSIWWDSKHECVATAVGQECGWVAYYHNGPQQYRCWQTTYCTQYAEK